MIFAAADATTWLAPDWHTVFFTLFALVTCVFALAVALSNNVVHMAFFLTISLGAVSGLFFLAGAEFVGAMQLMIYVGGTLVLLVFGVMLTAQQAFIRMRVSTMEWVVGCALAGALFVLLASTAFLVEEWREPYAGGRQIGPEIAQTTTQIGHALVGARVDKLTQANDVLRAGMSGYLLPFEVVGVHLLVVLIGAGYLARTKKVRPAEPLAMPRQGSLSGVLLWVLLAKDVLLFFFSKPAIDAALRAQPVAGVEPEGVSTWFHLGLSALAAAHAVGVLFLLAGRKGGLYTLACVAALLAALLFWSLDWRYGVAGLGVKGVELGLLYGLLRLEGDWKRMV